MSESQEQWLSIDNFDGTQTDYLVDNVFQIEWAGVLNDYAVLIRKEDLTGVGEVVPDIFKFNPEEDTLEEILDDDEKEYVVEFLIKQYDQQPKLPVILSDEECEE